MTRFQKKLATITALVGGLSLFDGLMTILILQEGAYEANPVMEFTLRYGYTTFMLIKMLLTVAGMVFLTMLAHRYRLALYCMYIATGIYLLLTGYHVALRVTL